MANTRTPRRGLCTFCVGRFPMACFACPKHQKHKNDHCKNCVQIGGHGGLRIGVTRRSGHGYTRYISRHGCHTPSCRPRETTVRYRTLRASLVTKNTIRDIIACAHWRVDRRNAYTYPAPSATFGDTARMCVKRAIRVEPAMGTLCVTHRQTEHQHHHRVHEKWRHGKRGGGGGEWG